MSVAQWIGIVIASVGSAGFVIYQVRMWRIIYVCWRWRRKP